MKLRPLARPYLSCQITSGRNAFFCHDDWTGLGPLMDIPDRTDQELHKSLQWLMLLKPLLVVPGFYPEEDI